MTAYEYSTKLFDLSKQGKLIEAYELAKEGLAIYPTNPHLLNHHIYINLRMGKIKEAGKEAEEQFHNLKGIPSFLRTYLYILDRKDAQDDILKLVDSGIFYQDFQGKAKPEFFISVANILTHAKLPDKAAEILRHAPKSEEVDKALEDMSKHEAKRGPVLNKYAEQFKGKRAVDVIAEIELIRPMSEYKGDFDLHLILADSYRKIGELEKASEIYKYLLTIRDDDFIRNKLGLLYKKMGKFDEAVIYLKEGLMKDPHKTHLHQALEKIYLEKKDPEGFERVAKDILAVHPKAGHLYGLIRRVNKACSE